MTTISDIHQLLRLSYYVDYGARTGASGAGKSTLTDLIHCFYVPSEGRILLDEVNLNKVNLREFDIE